jgi:hypothetical protein
MRNDGNAVARRFMRTNANITDTEKATYNTFCHQHHILNDESPAGIQNGEHIGRYIALWDVDISEDTLKVALEKLSDRLVFIPALQVEVAEILAHLDQSQRDIVANWLSHQHRLEVDGPKGFSNVSVLVSWLLNRRYSVCESGLDMALGNVQNTGKRKIFWKESPKESREYVHGKKNFAFGQEEPKPKAAAVGVQQQEWVNGRRNHSYVPPEEAQKKVAAQAPDAWQEIINIQLRDWVTPNQQARLENEYRAGVAAGRTNREISESLAVLVKEQHRGR